MFKYKFAADNKFAGINGNKNCLITPLYLHYRKKYMIMPQRNECKILKYVTLEYFISTT